MSSALLSGLEVLIGFLIFLVGLCIFLVLTKIIDWFFDTYKEDKERKEKELNESYKRGLKDGKRNKNLH